MFYNTKDVYHLLVSLEVLEEQLKLKNLADLKVNNIID